MSLNAGSIVATLNLDTRSFQAGIRTAERDLMAFSARLERLGSGGSIASLTRSFAGLNAVLGTLALSAMTKDAVQAGEQMIALTRRLELIAASVNKTGRETTSAAEQFAWLSKTALDTGTDFDGLSKAWVKLTATAHGAGVTLDDLKEGIVGTIGAGAAMGVSADGLNKVFNAMSQIGGKGQLYLEELKQQMAEHLPLAMQITARGLGVTTQELMNLVKKGKVSADEFFEAWAKGSKEFQQFGPLLAATFTGQLQNFRTIWRTEVGGLMNDSGVSDALAGFASQFNKTFAQLVQDARRNSDGVGDALIDDAEAVAQAFVGTWNAVAPVVENIGRLTGGVFSEAMASYNSLPDVVRQWGVLGAMLLGAKPLQIIAMLAAIKEGGSALAGLDALMKGDTVSWYREANSSGVGRFFTRDNYDSAFGSEFSRIAIDGESVVDGKVTNERRQAVIKERLALEEQQLARLKTQLADANKPFAVSEGSAIPAQIAAQRKALSDEITTFEERRAMLLGLSQSIATPAPTPTFNPTTGTKGWSTLALPDPAGVFTGIREGRDKARQGREAKIEGIDLGSGGGAPAVDRSKLIAQLDKDLRAALKQANLLRNSFLNADDALVMLHQNAAEFAARRTDERKRIAASLMDEQERLYTLSEAELVRKAVQGEILRSQEQQERVGHEIANLSNVAIQAEGDKLSRLNAQLSVSQKLKDAAREMASYSDQALQDARAQLRLDELRVDTLETQARARDYARPDFRAATFASDKANADLDEAKLYYSYSLTLEQRLQLTRAEGIRSFVDEFSSGASSIITGQQRIGQGFSSMIGNMSKLLADFFAKWMVQQAALGVMGWLGIGGAAAPAAGTAAAIGPGTGFIYHTGGLVGQGGMPSRIVPSSLFAGAPRFHTGGLVSGEVPIIAKRGEAVFTPEQMNNADQLIRASQGGGQTITVNNEVTVNGGSSGNREQDQALAQRIGKEIENHVRTVVCSEMRQQMRPGGLLRGGY